MNVSIDREKHNAEKGWNGGLSQTDERFESNLTAVDPVTGEIKKSVHLRYPNYSGTLATAGGLVFLALVDGTVAAFDDTTLDELWKINLGSGFCAPPMTFEVNGKQYLAIASGLSAPARAKLVNTPELKDSATARCSTCSGSERIWYAPRSALLASRANISRRLGICQPRRREPRAQICEATPSACTRDEPRRGDLNDRARAHGRNARNVCAAVPRQDRRARSRARDDLPAVEQPRLPARQRACSASGSPRAIASRPRLQLPRMAGDLRRRRHGRAGRRADQLPPGRHRRSATSSRTARRGRSSCRTSLLDVVEACAPSFRSRHANFIRFGARACPAGYRAYEDLIAQRARQRAARRRRAPTIRGR